MSDSQTQHSRAEKPWDPRWSMMMFVALFAFLAFLVPKDWIKKLNKLIVQPKIVATGVYTKQVAQVDLGLANGTYQDLKTLKTLRAEIQLRRLSQVGPLTGDDVRTTMTHLKQYNDQLDLEPTASSRQAMRHELNLRLAKTLPRFKPDDVVKILDHFDAQYTKALTLKPNSTKTAPK